MELRHLETFLAVARAGSVTRAALEEGYSQSAITQQIRGLERSVDATLFVRSRQGVRLTDAGQRFHSYAQRLVALSREAGQVVKDRAEPAGTIEVTTMESLNSYRLTALIEECQRRYPKLRPLVRMGESIDPIKSLQRGEYDCGLIIDSQTHYDNLVTRALFEEPLVLIAAPGHPLAGGELLTTVQLLDQRVLVTEAGCAYRDHFLDLLGNGAVEPVPPLEFGTIEAIKRGVQRGLGISLLPRVTVEDELLRGELEVLPWEPPFRVHAQLAWHEDKWRSTTLEVFLDLAARVLTKQAPRPATEAGTTVQPAKSVNLVAAS